MASFESLAQSVISGREGQVKEQVQALIDSGTNPLAIITDGLIGGMNVVGARFKAGDMFVPEVLRAAKAMSAGLAIVKPHIADKDMPATGTVVIGAVQGDLHDIGKNLVVMMLEGAGFKVIDLGIDISTEKFIAAVKEHKATILAMAALLTTTMPVMQQAIELLTEEGLRDTVKVIVGGAPVTQDFANQIGADGYASDAAIAVDICKEWVA